MSDAVPFLSTAAAYKEGARTLPRASYLSPRVFAAEQRAIFRRQWHCAGRTERLPHPGDFVLRTVAAESLIIVRGRDGAIRAFFNVCRHRGTRLCAAPAGCLEGAIQCPYHGWTYALDGRLVGAPQMQDAAAFDRADYPLHEASVAEFGGFVFVNVASEPEPFDRWFGPMAARLARFDLASLETHAVREHDVRANWKLVFENYSECLHCPLIHPELAAAIPYDSGANDLVEGPFLGGYMQIAEGLASVTDSGRACAPPVAAGEDRRRAYYYSVMPNLLLSIHPDYVNYYLVTPVAPDRTHIETSWLFRPAAAGSAFEPRDAVDFWDRVNRQDWSIIERTQQGISSSRFTPGPYSPRESIAAAWDREYRRLMAPAPSPSDPAV